MDATNMSINDDPTLNMMRYLLLHDEFSTWCLHHELNDPRYVHEDDKTARRRQISLYNAHHFVTWSARRKLASFVASPLFIIFSEHASVLSAAQLTVYRSYYLLLLLCLKETTCSLELAAMIWLHQLLFRYTDSLFPIVTYGQLQKQLKTIIDIDLMIRSSVEHKFHLLRSRRCEWLPPNDRVSNSLFHMFIEDVVIWMKTHLDHFMTWQIAKHNQNFPIQDITGKQIFKYIRYSCREPDSSGGGCCNSMVHMSLLDGYVHLYNRFEKDAANVDHLRRATCSQRADRIVNDEVSEQCTICLQALTRSQPLCAFLPRRKPTGCTSSKSLTNLSQRQRRLSGFFADRLKCKYICRVFVLACGHAYHAACLLRFLHSDGRTCPLCRRSIN